MLHHSSSSWWYEKYTKSSLYGDEGTQSNPVEFDFHEESIISSNNSIGSITEEQPTQHQPQSSCISISNLKGGLRGGGLFQPSYLRFVSMIVECVLIHSPHSNLLNLISGQIMYGILNFALKDYKKEVGHKSNGLLQPIHHFDSDIILCAIISNDCF